MEESSMAQLKIEKKQYCGFLITGLQILIAVLAVCVMLALLTGKYGWTGMPYWNLWMPSFGLVITKLPPIPHEFINHLQGLFITTVITISLIWMKTNPTSMIVACVMSSALIMQGFAIKIITWESCWYFSGLRKTIISFAPILIMLLCWSLFYAARNHQRKGISVGTTNSEKVVSLPNQSRMGIKRRGKA
jgi:hypothetical protein